MGDPDCPNCAAEPGATCGNPLYICSTAHGHEHFEQYALAELLDDSGQVVGTTTTVITATCPRGTETNDEQSRQEPMKSHGCTPTYAERPNEPM